MILLLLHLIIFIIIYFIARKSVVTAIFCIFFVIFASLFISNENSFRWVARAEINPQVLHDNVMFYVQRCAEHAPLAFCRVLNNKPVFIINIITLRIVEQFSVENIFYLFGFFRSALTFFCYVGFFFFFSHKYWSSVRIAFLFWLMFYGIAGIFLEKSNTFVMSNIFIFLYLSGYGMFGVMRVAKNFFLGKILPKYDTA